MSVIDQVEARRYELDSRIEHDLAMNLEVDLEPEPLHGDPAVNEVLIISLAAQRWKSMLQTGWDSRELRDQPLQIVANEMLDRVIEAGFDRLSGDTGVHSPHHSVYDWLHDREADAPTKVLTSPHAALLERLSNVAEINKRLIEDPLTFEPTVEKKYSYRTTQERLARAGDKLFRDLFLRYANATDIPEKYQNLLGDTVDEEVATMVTSATHWADKHNMTQNMDMLNLEVMQESRFLFWVVSTGRQLRATRHGRFMTRLV